MTLNKSYNNMNKRKICIIMHNDLMDYPPMISLIDIMKELGEDIIYIGHYTDSPTTRRFEELGVKLIKLGCIIRKSKFPQNPKRSVRFSGKRTKRSVQKRKARNTQKAETKVL